MNGLSSGFQRTLDHIRSIADSEAHKGRLFERLMKTYFTQDPHYKGRFSQVWLWVRGQRPDAGRVVHRPLRRSSGTEEAASSTIPTVDLRIHGI